MEHNPQSHLKDRLLSRIETEQVEPRSRLFFQFQEYTVWSLWVLSVLVGAFAVAVSLFVVMYRQYALYEATHDSFLTFMVSVLPYVWFVVFVVMIVAAWYNLRHTKRGYRYSLSTVILSSVVVSFAGGAALQMFGFGYTIDQVLGDGMPMYMSQEKLERSLWQAPAEGRLLGVQVPGELDEVSSSTIIFKDSTGERWQMRIVELFPRDQELLRDNKMVRVLGEIIDRDQKVFHACGVFPWMMDKNITMKEMSKERQAFVNKVYDQKHIAQERLALLEDEAFVDTEYNLQTMGVCAKIATVRRMSESMH